MKQTAVEWLYDQIENKGKCIYEVIEQAKAMEKEQIMDAYLKGYLEEIPNPSTSHYYTDLAEQYYNETFKSE